MDQTMERMGADRHFDLAIAGMTCASCVARVEKALERVAGVRSAAVNLATETASVEVMASVGMPALLAAVAQAGYTARAHEDAPARSRATRREYWELLAALVLSGALLAGMLLPEPGWLALALATPVQFWLGGRFYLAGYRALRARTANMDLLVAIGTSAAYCLSLANLVSGGPLYFESSAVVIALIRLGKHLEGRAKRDAARALTGLASLRPAVAHVVGRGDVPLARLRPGDVLELRPGERVPADGVIEDGCGSFDESHITGESLAAWREVGAPVLAGAMNLDAVMRITVTHAAGETLLDRMARLIDAAQSSKPAVQKLADRVAAAFVPVVLAVGLVTFGGWLLAGAGVDRAMINGVSVLVIACPCALGLAIPAAILVGTGVAAKHGILIRDADAIERGAKVDFVVFDKTGTLTEGKPKLVASQCFGAAKLPEVERIAAALAAADTHVLSAALRRPGVAAATQLRSMPGRGVGGMVDGARYILGADRLVREAGGTLPEWRAAGGTCSYLATAGGEVLAAFAFADTARPDAASTVARLQASGCSVMLLSGDRPAPVAALAAALGIDRMIAEAGPERKLAEVEALRRAGHVVAMVGDGVNDAAALAAADVGIAMGSGADVAIEAADISLLRPMPALVADAMLLCRKVSGVLRQGLFWALIYNLVGIPLAAFGYLSPVIAGGAMAASSVCVLANALRLRQWRPARAHHP